MKLFFSIIQDRFLISIVSLLGLSGAIQLWQSSQVKSERLLVNAKNDCEVYIELGEDAVKNSPSLRALKFQNKRSSDLRQPGINSQPAVPGDYVMLFPSPSSSLPPNASPFDDLFFTNLLNKEESPKTLMVSVLDFDLQSKQAIVQSYCTTKPFTVKLENLYEKYQPIDRNIKRSDSDILF